MKYFVAVGPTDTIMAGVDHTWVDADLNYTLQCVVEQVKPKVRVYWKIAGNLVLETDQDVQDQDGDGIWEIAGTLTHKFANEAEDQELVCVVTDASDVVINEFPYKSIKVGCKCWRLICKHLLFHIKSKT